MKVFLAVLPDGSIRFRGQMEAPVHGSPYLTSPKGDELCGLAYDEAIKFAWIETDDAGRFVSGERLSLAEPAQRFEIPAFLRKTP